MTDDSTDTSIPVEPMSRWKWCGNPHCAQMVRITREFCRRCTRKPKKKAADK